MTKLACRYAIVQFMPFPETGEFTNAGIVLACPKTGFFSYRLERKKYARITHFFEELDGSVYKDALGHFEAELARVAHLLSTNYSSPDIVRNLFDHLVLPREAIVRFGSTRAIMVDSPAQAVDQLFEHYVSRKFANKEYQETILAKRVAGLVNSLDLTIPFREERLGTEDYAVTFPLVQSTKDGEALKLIKPLFLGQEEPNKIYQHGDGWLAKIRRLRSLKALPALVLFAIKQPDDAYPRRVEAAYNIQKELLTLGIQVIDTSEQDKLLSFAAS